MKIDSIIFSSSEAFAPFWNIQSRVWKTKFGIEPICLFFGGNKSVMSEDFGKVYSFSLYQYLPPVLQITCSKFLAFSLLPDLDTSKTYMIGDLDTIPLQTKWFTSQIQDIPDNDYVHLQTSNFNKNSLIKNGSKAEYPGPGSYDLCGYYHVAKGYVFDTLFRLFTFENTVNYIVSSNRYGLRIKIPNENIHNMGDIHDAYWCAEESYTSERLRKAILEKKIVFHNFDFVDSPVKTYIDRDSQRYCNDGGGWKGNDYIYDKEKLMMGDYVDVHCRRPYKEYEPQLLNLLSLSGMI